MHLGFRGTVIAIATAAFCLGAGAARAGDDGAAPLWVGIGSIFGPFVGFNKEEPPPIGYREHGKIVVPKSMDLPEPGASSAATDGWPVEQEAQRKALAKAEAKKQQVPVVGNGRNRYGRPFPNAPVTVRASDQPDGGASEQTSNAKTDNSVLGNLNPLGWVGLGKSGKLGPEPDREWLTDPPKGYRAPVAPTAAGPNPPATGQASN